MSAKPQTPWWRCTFHECDFESVDNPPHCPFGCDPATVRIVRLAGRPAALPERRTDPPPGKGAGRLAPEPETAPEPDKDPLAGLTAEERERRILVIAGVIVDFPPKTVAQAVQRAIEYGRGADLLTCVKAQEAAKPGLNFRRNSDGSSTFGPLFGKGGAPLTDPDTGKQLQRVPDGKAVTRFHADGLGGATWNEGTNATQREQALLRTDARYNVGIQTRIWKAIDCDLSSSAKVQDILDLARRKLGKVSVRTRAGSPRVTFLVECQEELRKHVVSFGDLGNVEVLGNGQQTVLHGTHKSGAAVEWDGRRPPAVTCARLTDFIESLTELGGTVVSRNGKGQGKDYPPPAGPAREHPVVKWFESSDHFLGYNSRGMLLDACPELQEEYTSPFVVGHMLLLLPTPAGSDGKPHDRAVFWGLHTHDQGHSYEWWLSAYGVPQEVIDAALQENGAALLDNFEDETGADSTPGGAAGGGAGKAAVILERASDIPPEKVDWLWHGFLARKKLNILAGVPATGKTTIALSFTATLTKGGKWPDGSQCAALQNVIIWSGEDDAADTLVPRLIAAGADLSRVYIIRGVEKGSGQKRDFDPATDMAGLREAARRIGGVGLFILDPIAMVLPAKTDSNKNAEVRRGLQPLIDAAAAMGAGVMGIHHLTKNTQGKDPLERLSGSLAFGAAPRVVLGAAIQYADDGTEKGRVLVRIKTTNAKPGGGFSYTFDAVQIPQGIEATCIAWGAAIEGSAKNILNEAEQTPDPGAEARGAVAGAKRFLRMVLANGPAAVEQIKIDAGQAGLSWRSVERAKPKLNVEAGRINPADPKSPWQWRLPEDLDDVSASGEGV